MGSLDKLCTSFKVPEQYRKSKIDHNYTESTWKENEHIWGPYLKLDISALSYVIMVLFEKLYKITEINPLNSISILHMFSAHIISNHYHEPNSLMFDHHNNNL